MKYNPDANRNELDDIYGIRSKFFHAGEFSFFEYNFALNPYSDPVYKEFQDKLANCLINADYHGLRGVVIRKEPDKLVLANPGYVRTGKKQMRIGGESDPRNKALMKMFNLINIGERAGSGVPNIFNVWADEGWEEPVIEERFDPDRTVLSLSFKKKQAIKTSDIAEYLGLSLPRTRALLNSMEDVVAMGGNRNRTYRLKEKRFEYVHCDNKCSG